MFDFLKKLWVTYYRLALGCSALILLIAAIGAVLNFLWLAAQGRLSEAATAYISMAVFGALVAFGVWVHCDATASSRRLEKHLKKDRTDDEEEDDDEDARPASSEHIRASRDNTS
jgi:ABC-type nickel/cobalt efflux system permease component RcnA